MALGLGTVAREVDGYRLEGLNIRVWLLGIPTSRVRKEISVHEKLCGHDGRIWELIWGTYRRLLSQKCLESPDKK